MFCFMLLLIFLYLYYIAYNKERLYVCQIKFASGSLGDDYV